MVPAEATSGIVDPAGSDLQFRGSGRIGEIGSHLDLGGDGGAGAGQQAQQCFLVAGIGIGRADQHHRRLRQRAADCQRTDVTGEPLIVGHLLGQLVVLLLQLITLLGELGVVRLLADQDRRLHLGGAQHDAERQRQEDRREGNDVRTHGNHQKSPLTQLTKSFHQPRARSA